MLNKIDARLSHVIRFVERVLNELNPGVASEVSYETMDGAFVLSLERFKDRWSIMHGAEGDDTKENDVPLLSASRQVRAEVFTVPPDGHQAPIERLIVAVADSLDEISKERSPQLEVAMRLVAALERAGFADEGGQ